MDGYSLMSLPLTERKDILEELLDGNNIIRFSESYEDGNGLYQQMLDKNLEGIVAKKGDLFKDILNPKWATANNKILQTL